MKNKVIVFLFLIFNNSFIYSQMNKLNEDAIDNIINFHRSIHVETINEKFPITILVLNIKNVNDSVIVDIVDLNSLYLDLYSRNMTLEYLKLVGLESNYIVLVNKGWDFISFFNECYKVKITSKNQKFKTIYEPLTQNYYVNIKENKVIYLGYSQ